MALGIVLPEPPDRWHPVGWFGSIMAAQERRLWRDRRDTGALHAAVGVAMGALAGYLSARLIGPGMALAAATASAVGARGLDQSAAAVGQALERHDLAEARRLLPGLVGRDPTQMDETDVSRAVVESLAENTTDALVASAWWAAVAGPSGVLAHRASNTLDAMVGHRSPRYANFGWSSARLDDAAAWVPARLCAALVAVVRPGRAPAIWRTVRRDAPAHPSPNAGVAEAAFAAALDLRLGGANVYGDRIEHRPPMGGGRRPETGDIDEARRLARHVGWTTVALLVAPAAGRWLLARTGDRR